MTYTFSQDWVSARSSEWAGHFSELKGQPGVRMLEIGSYEGRSAVWWLENILTHDSASLVCIDTWAKASERERVFDQNIVNTGQSHKVKKIKALSRKALGWIPDRSLDAIYIDGSHEARDVLLDALMALPLVKPGGVMLFDDYLWPRGNSKQHGPQEGIDSFLSICDWQIEIIHSGYQVAVRVK
jgi:predicted O-methyltransferase YrrM